MAFCFLPHPSRLLQEYWDLVWKPHDIHSGFIGNLGEVLVGDFHQLVCGSPQGAPFLQSPPVGRVGLGHLVVEVLPRRFPETLRLLFVMYLASDPLVQRARVEQEAQAFLGDEVHHVVEVWSCRTIPPRWWSRSFSPVGLFASVAEPLRTRCPWSSLRVVYKLGRSSHAPFCIPGYIVLPRIRIVGMPSPLWRPHQKITWSSSEK